MKKLRSFFSSLFSSLYCALGAVRTKIQNLDRFSEKKIELVSKLVNFSVESYVY